MQPVINNQYKIRLNSYKSLRHYGGRDITTFAHVVNATLTALQDGGSQPYIFTLDQDVKNHKGQIVYKAGHKIAISPKDIVNE